MSSPFQHVDDARAPLHTTDPDHHEALNYGGEVPPKQLNTVVLGPPAYGSPDPATLAHSLNPLDDRPTNAPDLDPVFSAQMGRPSADLVVSEDELEGMSKAEIKDLIDSAGIDVPAGATKQEMIEALVNSDDDSDDSSS